MYSEVNMKLLCCFYLQLMGEKATVLFMYQELNKDEQWAEHTDRRKKEQRRLKMEGKWYIKKDVRVMSVAGHEALRRWVYGEGRLGEWLILPTEWEWGVMTKKGRICGFTCMCIYSILARHLHFYTNAKIVWLYYSMGRRRHCRALVDNTGFHVINFLPLGQYPWDFHTVILGRKYKVHIEVWWSGPGLPGYMTPGCRVMLRQG